MNATITDGIFETQLSAITSCIRCFVETEDGVRMPDFDATQVQFSATFDQHEDWETGATYVNLMINYGEDQIGIATLEYAPEKFRGWAVTHVEEA